MISFWDFFTDPVFRGPTWGTLLMCISSSLMGVILLLKRRSLLGETLSHAAYPGIVLGITIFATLFPEQSEGAFFAALGGAFTTSLFGLRAVEWMEKRQKVPSDAALCFVLALFFGVGTVLVSALQITLPAWHHYVQTLLFGQAATMTDFHIALYAVLTLTVVILFAIGFRPLQAWLFDPDFVKSSGLRVRFLERALFWLLLLSLILGIRSVGVVLMSGMAIIPAIAARQFTDRLRVVFWLAAIFGALSGLVGNILSVVGTIALSTSQEKLTLPTGPAIILSGAAIALCSLLFAPKRGLLFRQIRMASFRVRCLKENILKSFWKKGAMTSCAVKQAHPTALGIVPFILWRLKWEGWLERTGNVYTLSSDGMKKAASIVRLHRLWELYLASELGFLREKVHVSAEEMEHIVTPDLEERLTRILANPTVDPHHQPIPDRQTL